MSRSENENIEKLTGVESYRGWKFGLTIFLRAKGLLDLTKEQIKKQDDDKTFDEKLDAQGQALIISTVDRKHLQYILTCETAAQMYKTLCDIYDGQESRNKCNTLQDFFNYKYQGQDMTEFLSEMDSITFRLSKLGSTIEEDMIMSKILSSLPETYSSFVTAWESSSDKTLSNLKNRLLLEENRKNCQPSTSSIAFKANTAMQCLKCNKKGHKAKDCRSKQCSICKKYNHLEERCFFRDSNKNKYKKPGRVAFLSSYEKNTSLSNQLEFIVDSGCSAHMTNNLETIKNFRSQESAICIAKSEAKILSKGIGTVEGDLCVLNNTLFVPELSQNLMSVNEITNNGGSVTFSKDTVKICKEDLTLYGKKNESGLYTVKLNQDNNKAMCAEESWHIKMGHPGKKAIKNLSKIADGILPQEENKCEDELCEVCIMAKQTRKPFNTERTRATSPLEIIHTDVCYVEQTTWDGMRYIVTVLDDYTHFTKVYLMKNKFEVPEIIKQYINEAERELDLKVKKVRCDNGGEYTEKEFKIWCQRRGIKLDYTIPHSPQLNGKAERLNRSLIEKARALLFQSGLDKEMWGEAVLTATYLMNRLPSKTTGTTPYELWYKTKPNLANIRTFGSVGYVKSLGYLKKLQTRTKKQIMIGYAPVGYRMWDPERRKITIQRDIIFDKKDIVENNIFTVKLPQFEEEEDDPESKKLSESKNNSILQENEDDDLEYYEPMSSDTENNNQERQKDKEQDIEIENKEQQKETEQETLKEIEIENKEQKETEQERNENTEGEVRTKRTKKMPEKYNDYVLLTYEEAIASKEKANWEKAIQTEMTSLEENKTWVMVNKEEAKGHKILSNKWVFRIKDDGTYKARLVVRGCEQKGNLDYDEIYSPVVCQTALKTLFAIAAANNHHILTFDVKTAFLYGELSEKVFMKVPKGYNKTEKVCLLKKALYGLKQAPLTWNKTFTQTMTDLGFKSIKNDRCVFVNKDKSVIIALYVDDGLVIGQDKENLKQILNKLENTFQMKKNENPTCYLGMEIQHLQEGIKLTQKNYINSMLQKYGMENAKPCDIPSTMESRQTQETSQEKVDYPYREVVGSLLYLSTRTRPDVAQAVNQASRKTENPSKDDVTAVKKILKYLVGTKDKGIMFKRNIPIGDIRAFSDSDYAGDLMTRRSTTGTVLMLENGPIYWSSKRQPIVALSSTESEFIAAADTCKDAMYLKSVLKELVEENIKLILHVDNQSSMQLIKTGSFNKRSKHIDVRYHHIYEKYVEGQIDVAYCPSEIQLADIMTKPLNKVKFQRHCNNLIS